MSIGILFAVIAGMAVSTLPLISWFQGPALNRQLWMIVLGHAIILPVLLIVALAMGVPMPGPMFVLVAAAAGACNGANGAIYYAGVMNRGPMSISWAIVWLSAVLVAAIGWLFLGEPIYFAQPIAVACFIGCLIAMARATYLVNRAAGAVQPIKRGYWTLLIAAMAVGVLGVVLIKVQATWRHSVHDDIAFVIALVAGLVAVLLAFVLLRRAPLPIDRRMLSAGLLWGLVIGPCFMFLVAGLRLTSASVYQPTYSGVALILGVVWSLIRGERPHRLVYVGVALAVMSIVLINLQGPVIWQR